MKQYAKGYYADGGAVTQQIKYVAQKLADNQQQNVEVVVFGWDGANNDTSRYQAAQELSLFITRNFSSPEYRLILF